MATSGAGGGTGDIRMGGAFVEIYSKDKLSKQLETLRVKFNSFGKFVNTLGNRLAVGGAALLAPISALFAGGLSRAANMQRLAEQFGGTAEQLSRLSFAAEQAGVSIEEVMANQGKYAALMERAPIFDSETAKRALETQRLLAEATGNLQAAALPLLEVLMPLVKAFSLFAKENQGVVVVLAAVGAGVLGVAVALKAMAAAAAVASAMMAVLNAVSMANPWVLLGAAIAAVSAALVAFVAYESGALKELASGWDRVLDTFKEAWKGILDALKSGDLKLASAIAFKGMEVAFYQALDAMLAALDKFIRHAVEKYGLLVKAIRVLFTGILPGLFMPAPDMSSLIGKGRSGLGDAIARAQREMRELNERAAKQAKDAEQRRGVPYGAMNAAYTRGAFGGPLRQQLGIGDNWQKRLLEVNQAQLAELKNIDAKIGIGGMDRMTFK